MNYDRGDANAGAKYDVPMHQKTTPASKDSDNVYSTLSMDTRKEDSIYEPVVRTVVREQPKIINCARTACYLAISAGVAIVLMICFIAIVATLFVKIARLRSEMISSQESSAVMVMVRLQEIDESLSGIQALMKNENSRIEARINHSVDALNISVNLLNQNASAKIQRLSSSIRSTQAQLNVSADWLNQQLDITNSLVTGQIQQLNSSFMNSASSIHAFT
jgi:hypothetical protein